MLWNRAMNEEKRQHQKEAVANVETHDVVSYDI